MRYRVKKKKILYIHFHNFVDYTSIISNVSYRCISRARHVFVPLLKSPLKIERTKQPGQWTTGKFSSVTRINKTTVKIYREAGSNANSFSFASGKFAERSVFTEGGWRGNLLGAESLADTLIQARAITFDYLKNRRWLKWRRPINPIRPRRRSKGERESLKDSNFILMRVEKCCLII